MKQHGVNNLFAGEDLPPLIDANGPRKRLNPAVLDVWVTWCVSIWHPAGDCMPRAERQGGLKPAHYLSPSNGGLKPADYFIAKPTAA